MSNGYFWDFEADLVKKTFDSNDGRIANGYRNRIEDGIARTKMTARVMYLMMVIGSIMIFWFTEADLLTISILTLILILHPIICGKSEIRTHVKQFESQQSKMERNEGWESFIKEYERYELNKDISHDKDVYYDKDYGRRWSELQFEINHLRKIYYNPTTKKVFIPIQNIKEVGDNPNLIEFEDKPYGYYDLSYLKGRIGKEDYLALKELSKTLIPTFDEVIAILKAEAEIRLSNNLKVEPAVANQELLDMHSTISLKTLNKLRQQSNKLGKILSEIEEEELPYFYKENKVLMDRLIEESK